MSERPRRVRVPDLLEKKRRGEKIAMLTAYDATFARLLDRAGVDVLLVGDSLGMVILGYEHTVPVTLDDMIHHTRAVARGTRRALVVADMPFMTYQADVADALRNAGRLLLEGGAAAGKIEGGAPVVDVAQRLVEVGIPVMGHLGLQPQSVHRIGSYAPQATSEHDAEQLMRDARSLEAAGVFAVVLESIPCELASEVTRALAVPTVGIGAGPGCDGQVLVSYDALGLYDVFVPSFVKQYARLADTVTQATRTFVDDVREGRFPGPEHTFAGRKKAGTDERGDH